MKQCILLLTDKDSPVIVSQYEKLKNETGATMDVYLLFHQKESNIVPISDKNACFVFDDSILSGLGFIPIEEKLIPGSNHFPLFGFHQWKPQYDYYWIVEDDVRFTGDWSCFFNRFIDDKTDFLSCCMRDWHDDPFWYWWGHLGNSHVQIALNERTASFNPIYRISNSAVCFMDKQLRNGWSGHHEVAYATLLKQGGFNISDFGGDGKYVRQNNQRMFYIDNGARNPSSTMRFKPVFEKPGELPDKLYHPVKDFGQNSIVVKDL